MTLHDYTITSMVSQGKTSQLNVPHPTSFPNVLGVKEIKLISAGSELKIAVNLEEETDDRALEKAKQVIQSLVFSLALSNRVGLTMGDPRISAKRIGNNVIFSEVLTLENPSVSWTTTLGEDISSIVSIFNNLVKCPKERFETLTRCMRWYTKGILEEDKVDMFIDFYIAIEVLGEYYFSKGYATDRVRNVIDKFKDDMNFRASEVTYLRGALLHSGRKEEEARGFNSVLSDVISNGILDLINKL